MISLFAEEDDELCITKEEGPLSPIQEILTYQAKQGLKSTDDPLLFWKQHASELPRLTKLALKYACVQGSSVASERIFSTAGDIVTAERSCIDPEHVDRLIFLKKNKYS